ncbi:hypothetical protein AWB95_04380 [Mycobacterium celatum]|uniref:Uncharacterized protein n=1 Tax=Mycobacterium celatum TaxID=28045 RepID=A0A1X1RUH4_MYCCE|nr:hypothetical protein AWB95_04380 [Mycobacterium celatum]PIB80463.1 hypothetical protein CQY23_02625 [Mycobacterium celatum]
MLTGTGSQGADEHLMHGGVSVQPLLRVVEHAVGLIEPTRQTRALGATFGPRQRRAHLLSQQCEQ